MNGRPEPEVPEDIIPTLDDFAGWPPCGPASVEFRVGPAWVSLHGLDQSLEQCVSTWLGARVRSEAAPSGALQVRIELLRSERPHYLKKRVGGDARTRLRCWKESGARLMASHHVALLMDASGESGMACLTAQEDAHLILSLHNCVRVAVAWRLALSGQGLLLHGAAVLTGERAGLLVAASGAGKTTAARLSSPRQVVCDDALVVSQGDEGWLAHETPLWAESEFPLRARPGGAWPVGFACALKKASSPDATGLSRARGLALLAAHAPFMVDEEDARAVSSLASSLAQSVRMAELSFAAAGSFWQALDAFLDDAGPEIGPSRRPSA